MDEMDRGTAAAKSRMDEGARTACAFMSSRLPIERRWDGFQSVPFRAAVRVARRAGRRRQPVLGFQSLSFSSMM
jgi:hypothetical protein